jgi:hypothetical protein
MAAIQRENGWAPGPGWPGRGEEKLDRALVAGLLLEALLEARRQDSPGPQHARQVKTHLKRSLTRHLAGYVTLDRFRTLMAHLDPWFARYYPLLAPLAGLPAGLEAAGGGAPLPALAAPPRVPVFREDLLEDWRALNPGLFPSRPHRKLTWDKLKEFLSSTRGRWFGVKDLARDLGLERKTAWEYLRKLREAGLLRHNGACSAAARYSLEDHFLRVRGEDLRLQVARTFPDWPEDAAASLADYLLATSGEVLWEGEWAAGLPSSGAPGFLERLVAAGLLEVAASSGPARLLRLHPRWLREDEEASATGA